MTEKNRMPLPAERPDLYDDMDCRPSVPGYDPLQDPSMPPHVKELIIAKRDGWSEFAMARLRRQLEVKT